MDPYQNYQPGQDGPFSGQDGDYQQPYRQYQQPPQQNETRSDCAQPHPGKEKARTALILGIVSAAATLLNRGGVISVIAGIVGLVMASKAKKLDYSGGERTAAVVLSVIGILEGALAAILIAIVFVIGAVSWIDFFSFFGGMMPF